MASLSYHSSIYAYSKAFGAGFSGVVIYWKVKELIYTFCGFIQHTEEAVLIGNLKKKLQVIRPTQWYEKLSRDIIRKEPGGSQSCSPLIVAASNLLTSYIRRTKRIISSR
jgi:hypothetical protein